ncbi:MAG: hypothetical protein FWG27_06205 [Treponema sp.]|nr:hypothetical protein [Treponema sp.]
MKKLLLLLLFCFSFIHSAAAAEYVDGRIRLVLHESTGRFSLYYMADMAREEYLPFFMDKDPRTSFLSLMINNRSYKMGESSAFRTRIGGTPANPVLIFESAFLTVTQEFSFVKTGSSSLTNGIEITITVFNRGEQPVEAGIRFLIDTTLGEKNDSHFITDEREISGETIINSSSMDRYWVSGNSQLALMGSVDNLVRPDFIHFANWKRLNDAPWKIPYVAGRNFNLLPYSIDDSAVAYYYEPAPIPRGSSRTVSFLLSSEDASGFRQSGPEKIPESILEIIPEIVTMDDGLDDSLRADLAALKELAAKLDDYISSEAVVGDNELSSIEILLSRIRSKYSIP